MVPCRLAAGLLLAISFLSTTVSFAQEELAYEEYHGIARTAITMHHCAMFEPLDGQAGMHLVIGDKFGKVNVYRLNGDGDHSRIWASRQLEGSPEEVLIADLDSDGLDDTILCRTMRRIYAWDLTQNFYAIYESTPNDFRAIRAFTVANVDDDPAKEIVINADSKIHYVDGGTFTKEWTSLLDYEAVRMRCGDVDGDNRVEIVLNTGQVIDSGTGEVEWSDQVFGVRLELLDFDGDGILEVVTEGEGTPLRVWDVDFKSEKRFQ